MRNGIKTILTALLSSVIMVSCIYDKYPGRRQYDISIQLMDNTGMVLPESVAHLNNIYWFVNGVYQKTVYADSDGKYRLSFNAGDRVTFVALAGSDSDMYTVYEPHEGESITNTWLQLNTNGSIMGPQPSGIYYGCLDVVPEVNTEDLEEDVSYTLTMHEVRAKARVLIKGLEGRYGKGSYRIVMEGLRSGIAYDGSSTGRYVNYDMTPDKSYGDGFDDLGNYWTEPIYVLPTRDEEPVRLLVYKANGELLFDRDIDEEGAPLLINEGEDVVLVIQASYITELGVTIVPWSQIDNSGVFY